MTADPDAAPFWNRRWAMFEDEDHQFCVVTDDDAAEYVVWPEMGERDVRRVVDAHNTVLNVAQMPDAATASPGLDVERLMHAINESGEWPLTQGIDMESCHAIAREYAALAADRETPKDFGSQVAMKGGLPKDLAERIDRIEGR